jgi:hypothetical protein
MNKDSISGVNKLFFKYKKTAAVGVFCFKTIYFDYAGICWFKQCKVPKPQIRSIAETIILYQENKRQNMPHDH